MSARQPHPFTSFNELRDFAVSYARMIAALAVDPHGYFEKGYTARIELAETDDEVFGVLSQLIEWTTSSALSDANRKTLNKKLADQAMPSIDELSLIFNREHI